MICLFKKHVKVIFFLIYLQSEITIHEVDMTSSCLVFRINTEMLVFLPYVGEHRLYPASPSLSICFPPCSLHPEN